MDLARPLGVVTPTLDGDVLAALALVETAFTVGQLHRVLPEYSEDGIRRVLHRLTGQGIVTSDRAGNAYLYRLNRAHLAAEPIGALARLRATFLDLIEKMLATWDPAPVYGAVFGSAARSTMRAESDIDLLLVRPDTGDHAKWEDLVITLTASITEWTGNDTRVLEFTESEVRHAGREEPVLADVRDHGLTVAGSAAWLAQALKPTEDLMARIDPVQPPYPPEIAERLAAMMPPGVPPILLFRTFVRNLPMATAMGGWGGYELSKRLSLPMRDREIIIDRTCARCGCEYEWGVHVAFFAERVGLSAQQITSLTRGAASDPCWTQERDRLLIEAADALHDCADIGDDLWARLAGFFTDEQLLDLLMLCGWYHAISFTANGARVGYEDGAPRFADVLATRSA